MKNEIVKLQEENIKLRKIKLTDFKYFLKWWQDKELIKLTSGVTKKNNIVLKVQ
jgi:hypothetical protein